MDLSLEALQRQWERRARKAKDTIFRVYCCPKSVTTHPYCDCDESYIVSKISFNTFLRENYGLPPMRVTGNDARQSEEAYRKLVQSCR